MIRDAKVAIHGSYFADNYGDTLLVRLMCDMVASIAGRRNVYLAVPGHIGEQRAIGYPVLSSADRSKVTHLIYGGGGYLGERSGKLFDNSIWSLRNYRRHISWRKDFKNARSAIIGAGFGPISNSLLREKIKKVVLDADLVLLRDMESIAFAESYGIAHPSIGMCVDLALSLPVINKSREGFAIHTDNLDPSEIEIIFESLSSLYANKIRIDVIFDNPPSFSNSVADKYRSAALKFGITEVNFKPYDRFDSMVERVSNYALVITSKLHVGITCIAQGGRAISIPTHQKTIRLYRQLGITEFCIPRADLSRDILSSSILAAESFEPDRSIIARGISKVRSALNDFIK